MPTPTQILELFLRLLFDHPAMDGLWKAVVSIYPAPNKPGETYSPHAAAQSVEDIIRCINGRRNRRANNNYIAIGALADIKTGEFTRDGFPKITRVASNVRMLKALYVDIDVGKNGCYATTADAEAGWRKFLADSGMPDPTMQVYTGSGGFHLYWVLDEPLTVAEWQPLANALKDLAKHHGFLIDPAITADPARILRLPTTFNHKWDPPTECMMNMSGSFPRYTKAQLSKALSVTLTKAQAQHTQSSGPAPGLSAAAQNFTAGVADAVPPVPIDTLAAVCPVTAQLLATGGAGVSDPLWKLSLLLATFTSDPKDAAHRMSSGWIDPVKGKAYDPVDTDRQLQIKVDAKKANPKLGWPKCAQFDALHPACATCPHRSKGQSPFHFVPRNTAQSPAPKATHDPLMPEGYWRNQNDHVFTDTEKAGPIDVMGVPIKDGFITIIEGHKQLVALIEVGGHDLYADVDTAKIGPTQLCEAWHAGSRRNLTITGNLNKKAIGDFTMAWMKQLLAQHKTIHPRTFGWADDGDVLVFGDYAHTKDGPQLTYRGKSDDEKFRAKGKLQPWINAMQLIYGNPVLEVVVASAFAAPLVKFACPYSLVLSVFSYDSAHGKSTGMKCGQSVWGHPRDGMSGLTDTTNSVMEKVKVLRHLPVYWDEVKGDEQMEKLAELVFQLSGGKGKGRLTATLQQKDPGNFTTMFTAASNHSLIDLIVKQAGATEAGALRVFELEAPPLPPSTWTSNQTDPMLNELEYNYGVAGETYADFLARNRETAQKILAAIGDNLQATVKFETKERFYLHTMSTIITGAHIANQLGLTKFDVPAITSVLTDRVQEMRKILTTKQHFTMKSLTASDLLAHMTGDTRGRNMIETNIIAPSKLMGPGVKVTLMMPEQHLQYIWLQIGQDDGRIMCHTRAFEEWLTKNGYPLGRALDALRQDYDVQRVKATLGKGVSMMKGAAHQAWCYEMVPYNPPAPPDDPRQKKPETKKL